MIWRKTVKYDRSLMWKSKVDWGYRTVPDAIDVFDGDAAGNWSVIFINGVFPLDPSLPLATTLRVVAPFAPSLSFAPSLLINGRETRRVHRP